MNCDSPGQSLRRCIRFGRRARRAVQAAAFAIALAAAAAAAPVSAQRVSHDDTIAEIVAAGRLVSNRPDARVAYVTREDCAAAAAGVLATDGHENKAYNITGPELVGPQELAALASEISGKPVEFIAMNEDDFVEHLREGGMPDAAIQGTLSFAAELDSPYLRETSTAVADLSGRPATSVRSLLEANRQRLVEAARGRGLTTRRSAKRS